MYLGSNIIIIGRSVLSTNQWHHFGFVYDGTQQTATIYIDQNEDQTRTSVKPTIVGDNINSSIIVGAGFYGYLDQLSIKLKAKSSATIVWDATTVAYYPLDEAYILDKGPNGVNATASNVISIYGWRYDALNFNLSTSYFKAGEFSALGMPAASFSITLWVRAEAQPGIFLTIANPYTCLLALGFQTANNYLIAYLPNATSSGNDVTVYGPLMPFNAWVNVAFTWSVTNRAQLYTSGYWQGGSSDATNLGNTHGGNSSLPMTVTLGHYNGTTGCQSIPSADLSSGFMGSIDEVYIFGRELTINEIQGLTIVYPT